MKNIILKLALTSLSTGIILFGCQSASSKKDAAINPTMSSGEEMNVLQQANAEILTADRKVFKNMAEVKIKSNDSGISELKNKLMVSDIDIHSPLALKIILLEQKNDEMKIRKQAYEQSLNDWELFKKQYNSDLDGIGASLKSLSSGSTQ